MRPVILMPDCEKAVVAFLSSKLTGVTVSTRVPNPIPLPYIQIRRVGGIGTLVVDQPRIDLIVWADGDYARMQLAQRAHANMLAIRNDTASGVLMYSATNFLSPTQVPDPADSTKTVAFATVQVFARGTQV